MEANLEELKFRVFSFEYDYAIRSSSVRQSVRVGYIIYRATSNENECIHVNEVKLFR